MPVPQEVKKCVSRNCFARALGHLRVHFRSSISVFTITAEIRARSLAIFWSICGQTHEFKIHATRQRARAGISTIFYRKKTIDANFLCVCPFIDNEFRHNIVEVVCGSTRLSPRGSTATLTMLWRNSWSITGQTQKTDVNLLNNFGQITASFF